MPASLPPKLQNAWTRVKQVTLRVWTGVKTSAQRAWTRTVELSGQAWTSVRKVSQQGWSGASQFATQASQRIGSELKRGWISFRDSWTKEDWFAGIKPLPPGMAGNLTAIAIVTGLVLTSLVYGDYHERKVAEARLIPSGEHPSQQQAPAPEPEASPAPPPTPAPVPEPAKPVKPEAAPAPSAPSKLPQMGEAFVERFGSDDIDGRWYVSDGWSNGDWMDNDWRRSQLNFGGNGLAMVMGPGPEDSGKPLAGAEIRTNEFYRYGYFEVRMKVPRDPGIVTGVFTYAKQEGKAKPNEIDIEILGRDTRILEATIHENGKPTHKKIRLPFDSADGFHTYGLDWQPGVVRWYADGKMIHEERGPAAARLNRPQQFMINLWGSSKLKDWVGKFDIAKGPWSLDVACVAYAPTYRGESLCK